MGEDNRSDAGRESQIDQNLKRVFQRTLDEDLPDKLKDLLAQLKDTEKTRNGGAS